MDDIEAPDNDVLEQEQPPGDPARPLAGDEAERDLEAPEADSVEQNRPLRGKDEGGVTSEDRSVETDPADAHDHNAVEDDDEDDYR